MFLDCLLCHFIYQTRYKNNFKETLNKFHPLHPLFLSCQFICSIKFHYHSLEAFCKHMATGVLCLVKQNSQTRNLSVQHGHTLDIVTKIIEASLLRQPKKVTQHFLCVREGGRGYLSKTRITFMLLQKLMDVKMFSAKSEVQ